MISKSNLIIRTCVFEVEVYGSLMSKHSVSFESPEPCNPVYSYVQVDNGPPIFDYALYPHSFELSYLNSILERAVPDLTLFAVCEASVYCCFTLSTDQSEEIVLALVSSIIFSNTSRVCDCIRYYCDWISLRNKEILKNVSSCHVPTFAIVSDTQR